MTKNRLDKIAIRNHMAISGEPYSVAAKAAEGFPLTSWLSLDTKTGGFRRQALYLIGAEAGAGRTAFSVNLALKFAQHRNRVALFTFESIESEVAQLAASSLTGVDVTFARKNDVELSDRQKQVLDRISVSDAQMSVADIREYVEAHPELDAVIVDHFQLLSFKNIDGYIQQGYSSAMFGLKKIAYDFNIPVIVTAVKSRHLYSDSTMYQGGLSTHADCILDLKRTSSEIEDTAEYLISVSKDRFGQAGDSRLLAPNKHSAQLQDGLKNQPLTAKDFEMKWDDEHSFPFFAEEAGNGYYAYGSLSDQDFADGVNEFDELCDSQWDFKHTAEGVTRFVGIGGLDAYGSWRIYPCPPNFPGACVIKHIG